MSDSLDGAVRASNSGETKRRGTKLQQENDTPEAREKRILLYMSRANVTPDADESERRKGENGRPLNIFTGLEYAEDEIKGQLFEGE